MQYFSRFVISNEQRPQAGLQRKGTTSGGSGSVVSGASRLGGVSVMDWEALGAGDSAIWSRLQEDCPHLASPFLRPEFAGAVARFVPGVKVAVLEGSDGARAFWTFQEERRGVGSPVGGKFGCLHGLVAPSDFVFDPADLLEAAGLDRWHFDHLLADQAAFSAHHFEIHESPYLDLAEGFDRYLEGRLALGRTNRNIENALRKRRNLERDRGRCLFEADCGDEDVIGSLIRWKRDQMRETGQRDLFVANPWIEPFLRETLESQEDAFRGALFVLRVGGEPAAAFYGLRSQGELHGLLIGYNHRFAPYSPGILLLVELAQRASSMGLRRIELGKGREFYKQTLKSGSRPVAVGAVCRAGPVGNLLRTGHRVKSSIARSNLGPPLKRWSGRIVRGSDRILRRHR